MIFLQFDNILIFIGLTLLDRIDSARSRIWHLQTWQPSNLQISRLFLRRNYIFFVEMFFTWNYFFFEKTFHFVEVSGTRACGWKVVIIVAKCLKKLMRTNQGCQVQKIKWPNLAKLSHKSFKKAKSSTVKMGQISLKFC